HGGEVPAAWGEAPAPAGRVFSPRPGAVPRGAGQNPPSPAPFWAGGAPGHLRRGAGFGVSPVLSPRVPGRRGLAPPRPGRGARGGESLPLSPDRHALDLRHVSQRRSDPGA